MLITSDLDLIQEVFIKKFSYFAARKVSLYADKEHVNSQVSIIARSTSSL